MRMKVAAKKREALRMGGFTTKGHEEARSLAAEWSRGFTATGSEGLRFSAHKGRAESQIAAFSPPFMHPPSWGLNVVFHSSLPPLSGRQGPFLHCQAPPQALRLCGFIQSLPHFVVGKSKQVDTIVVALDGEIARLIEE